tara:strand:+ start:2985 stop:3917 length:933 start_codon:yes stop_codon:yes gene_type:complete
MSKLFKYSLTILLLFFLNNSHALDKITIKYKINNLIITNVDIEKEIKYLMALNVNLKTLDQNQLNKIASNSIINEKIKKIALKEQLDSDKNTEYLNQVIKNFYKTLNLDNEEQFKIYLEENNLTLNFVKEKIRIETAWNQLVYKKFEKQIKINKNFINKKISEASLNTKTKKYLFSEILFTIDSQNNFEKKIKLINLSISEIGFENTANLYSISDSAKFGGSTGWVEKNSLSKIIYKKINNLDKGSISSAIQIGNNFLILRVDDIKEEIIKINEEDLINKIIFNEREKQLQLLSKNYFNRIKINTNINEY